MILRILFVLILGCKSRESSLLDQLPAENQRIATSWSCVDTAPKKMGKKRVRSLHVRRIGPADPSPAIKENAAGVVDTSYKIEVSLVKSATRSIAGPSSVRDGAGSSREVTSWEDDGRMETIAYGPSEWPSTLYFQAGTETGKLLIRQQSTQAFFVDSRLDSRPIEYLECGIDDQVYASEGLFYIFANAVQSRYLLASLKSASETMHGSSFVAKEVLDKGQVSYKTLDYTSQRKHNDFSIQCIDNQGSANCVWRVDPTRSAVMTKPGAVPKAPGQGCDPKTSQSIEREFESCSRYGGLSIETKCFSHALVSVFFRENMRTEDSAFSRQRVAPFPGQFIGETETYFAPFELECLAGAKYDCRLKIRCWQDLDTGTKESLENLRQKRLDKYFSEESKP